MKTIILNTILTLSCITTSLISETVENPGVIRDSQYTVIEVEFTSGWNMISLPVIVDNAYYQVLYPEAESGSLFFFDLDNGYQNADSLIVGKGYWLFFSESGMNEIRGERIDSLTIYLQQGWNFISGTSDTVSVFDIIDPDGIIVEGTWYVYDIGFNNAILLVPGASYWVNARNDGWITFPDTLARFYAQGNNIRYENNVLSSFQSNNKMFVLHEPENANTITINGQTLYFGVEIPEDEKLSFSLPPKPPVGSFDVRFSADWKYCEDYGEIEIMNPDESLTVSYEVKDSERWVLVNSSTGEEYALRGTGEIKLFGNVEKLALKKMDSPAIPGSFALHPAYPNPFNPVTKITYDLPFTSRLSLIIYDLAGREIAELVNSEVISGTHYVVWDAVNQPSGIYFVKMTATPLKDSQSFKVYSMTRKVLLLK